MFIAYNSNLYSNLDEVFTLAASGDTLEDYAVGVFDNLDDTRAGIADLMADYAERHGDSVTSLVYEVVEVVQSAKVYTAMANINVIME